MQPLAINPADLRHSISVVSRSTVQDAMGGVSMVWNTVLSTRAKIAATSFKEQSQADKLTAVTSHIVTIRWQPVTIAPGMRVQFGTRNFEIQSVDNVLERNRVVRLMVAEIFD